MVTLSHLYYFAYTVEYHALSAVYTSTWNQRLGSPVEPYINVDESARVVWEQLRRESSFTSVHDNNFDPKVVGLYAFLMRTAISVKY